MLQSYRMTAWTDNDAIGDTDPMEVDAESLESIQKGKVLHV